MRRVASWFFFTLSLICFILCAYLVRLRIVPHTVSASPSISADFKDTAPLVPLSILLPNSSPLPVVPVTVKESVWQTTNTGVSYLETSPLPGERGNSIFYGHNWPNLLGSLHSVQNGQIITIQMSDGTERRFVVVHVTSVTPDQTHITDQTDDTRITIYTCSGFFDEKRFVVTAVPAQEI